MNDFDALLIFFFVQRRSLDEFLVSLVLLVCQWQTFSLTFALKLCKDTCHFDNESVSNLSIYSWKLVVLRKRLLKRFLGIFQ